VTEIVAVDTSGAALELLEEAARRNSIAQVRTVEQNVFDYLKEACQRSERFDTIVLDPPAFAKSRGEIPAAIRGYREINRRAMEILQPGGVLVSCSCSYHLSEADLIEVLRAAASDSRSDFRVLERRGQASDHPTILCHPESGYLKCILLEKV
jgi:23S rRNA (cytosine1962-C5)-methyltransferase